MATTLEPEVLTVLRSMDDILYDESTWTQGHYAENKYGYKVDALSPYACKFCIAGARTKALEHFESYMPINLLRTKVNDILVAALPKSSSVSFIALNDDEKTTFRRVKNLIKRAIKIAESRVAK